MINNYVNDHTHFSGLKMCHNILPISIYIWLRQCGSWNVVLAAIDACGNKIWSNFQRTLWAVFVILSPCGKKLKVNYGQRSHRSWVEVKWRFYPVCRVIWDHFCLGVISFCYFFALEVVRGHDFWTCLETCTELFDLLPSTLTNGTVNDEMRS